MNKKNYTMTLTVDHDKEDIVDSCGIPEDSSPMDIYDGIIEKLQEEGLDPFKNEVSATHVTFEVLPKVTPHFEAYLAFFIILGYNTWMDMVNQSIFEAGAAQDNGGGV